jgi:hypothetical protein
MARPPLFKRWVVACLVIAVVVGGGAAAWQLTGRGIARSAPRLDFRYDAAAAKLGAAQAVSPSEEYLNAEGEVVFLTQDELRAVSQASGTSSALARRLAGALAERDPERRAERLFALIDDVPPTADGDKEALVIYRFVSAALTTSPPAQRDAAKKANLDRLIGCRFVGPRLPPCPDRPSELVTWAPVALAILALVAGLFGLVSALIARRRAARHDDTAELVDPSGEEAEESA